MGISAVGIGVDAVARAHLIPGGVVRDEVSGIRAFNFVGDGRRWAAAWLRCATTRWRPVRQIFRLTSTSKEQVHERPV